MKKLFLFIISCMLASTVTVEAQNMGDRWSLGFGFAGRDFTGLPEFKAPASYADMLSAYTVQLNRYLNPAFDAGLQASFAPWKTPDGQPVNNLKDIEALLKLKLINGDWYEPRAMIVPYIQAGFGAAFAGSEVGIHPFVPAGVGFKIQSISAVSLDAFANYHLGLGDLGNYVTIGGGVNLGFGGGKIDDEPKPIIIEKPIDTDGDGIVDKDDDCPNESGLATFNGCPDTDQDGVADKDDNCPEVAGLISLKGCPEEIKDSDGDGIADEYDECPNVAGLATFKGCPDTDGDGIIDKEDDCPDIAGLKEFNGCVDTDGDGIRDKDDRCPDVIGVADMQGCPEIKEEIKAQLERITKSVKFKTGSAELLESSKTILDEIVSVMEEYPEYSMRISGHTDNVGDASKNQKLSEERAAACKSYLQSKGVDLNRMESAGYGESKPKNSNDTAAGKAENRRVEFELFVQ